MTTDNRNADAQAIDTVTRLQEATRSGVPIPIPGAREHARAAEVVDVIADPAAAQARAAAVLERIRVARVPDSVPKRSFLARLWRRVYRGPETVDAPQPHGAA